MINEVETMINMSIYSNSLININLRLYMNNMKKVQLQLANYKIQKASKTQYQ